MLVQCDSSSEIHSGYFHLGIHRLIVYYILWVSETIYSSDFQKSPFHIIVEVVFIIRQLKINIKELRFTLLKHLKKSKTNTRS